MLDLKIGEERKFLLFKKDELDTKRLRTFKHPIPKINLALILCAKSS